MLAHLTLFQLERSWGQQATACSQSCTLISLVHDLPQSPATDDSQEEGDKVQAKPARSTPGTEPSAYQKSTASPLLVSVGQDFAPGLQRRSELGWRLALLIEHWCDEFRALPFWWLHLHNSKQSNPHTHAQKRNAYMPKKKVTSLTQCLFLQSSSTSPASLLALLPCSCLLSSRVTVSNLQTPT